MNPQTLVRVIQKSLTTDLLKPDQRRRLRVGSHPTTGHCYVASEVLWHLYGREHGFVPQVIRVGDNTHWYLRNPATGEVLDATKEQFANPVDYDRGRGTGFLTGNTPSKRCQELLSRISNP